VNKRYKQFDFDEGKLCMPEWVSEAHEQRFLADIGKVIRTLIMPWCYSKKNRECDPTSEPLFSEPPTDAVLKEDAKKLLNMIGKLKPFTGALICYEAGLPEYTLNQIRDACENVANRKGKKKPQLTRLKIIFELDVIYRIYSGSDPQTEESHPEFIKFCHECLSSADEEFEHETTRSMARDYFKKNEGYYAWTSIAAATARMCLGNK